MTKIRHIKVGLLLLLLCFAPLIQANATSKLTCPSAKIFYNSKYKIIGEHEGFYYVNFGTKKIKGVNWMFVSLIDASNFSEAKMKVRKVLTNRKNYKLIQQEANVPTTVKRASYCIYIVKSASLALTWTGLFIVVTPAHKNVISFISKLPPVR